MRFIHSFALLFFLLCGNQPAKAQQDTLDVIRGSSSNNNWLQFSDARYALYHHLAGQAYDLLDERAHAIAKLHSLYDWKARQQQVRQILRDVVGPFPQKTPLHARITKTVDKNGYRIEDIIYQSQPGFYVTSSLFIPDGIDKPGPAVIYASGHGGSYYNSATKQHVILNLMKKGFIVFAFDPIGQGERLEYYDSQTGKSAIGNSPKEHTYPGAQAFITGSSEARYFIWDGIRAVDYLLSRKEVDPDRIGLTGWSGGGMQTAFIAAMDKRIYAAAPERWITSFTRLLQSIGPQDADQNLTGEIAAGLDQADLLEVRAPKPTLMITTTRDFFSIQGARETTNEVSRIYRAYSKEDHFNMVEDNGVHQSTQKNREAMYGFFQKYLNNPGSSKDEDVEPLSKKVLQSTRTGQVATSLKGETVFSLNQKEAKKEDTKLQAARKHLGRYLPKAVKAAKKLSGYRKPGSIGKPVFTGRFQKDGYAVEKYFLQGEGDYPIPYLLLVPDKPNGKALIYLDPAGKTAHLQQEQRLARNGFTVLAPDLLGVGEMGEGKFYGVGYIINGVGYTNWFASLLIDRSIVGIHAGDIVRLARLLQERKRIREVCGLARQQMGPALLHAASFDSSIARIALIEPYSSYRSIVMNRFYEPDYISSSVAGALQAYDLPDLAASLAPRKLLVAGMRDGTGAPADSATIHEDTAVIKAAYRQKDASRQLGLISGKSVNNLRELLIDWLK